MEKNRASILFR